MERCACDRGREWGELGFDEYLEIKSLFGYVSDSKPPAHCRSVVLRR